MERLTDKAWRNLDPWECCGQDNYCKRGCHDEGGCYKGCIVPKIYDELARYEDAEEQGRMIVLPCKLWDTLYDAYTGDIRYHYVTEFSTRGKDIDIQVNDFYAVGGCYCHASDIGKTVFLTREEAEVALKGGNDNEKDNG